ncbi:MAG: metallophosphoesterase [Candidatus Nanohaloarchaeota archaeon QJJ-7]|nr:metallophosphoesterase [Candidatus Nanohaloarchaeota archaeon QJJ-7]
MKLLGRFETVESYPAIYDPEADAAVVSDLHLGLESLMAEGGVFMPKFQLKEMKEDLEELLEQTGAEKLIVLGDVKHEFSETSKGEKEEVQELLDFLSDRVEEVLLVKGNHDNYLIYAVEDYDHVELEDRFVLEDALYIHGHELVEDLETFDASYVVIGHEHPALALKDEVGVKEKLPAFLYGEMDDGRELLVLPAFSKLADGSQVNQVSEEELMSPFLKQKIDIGEMEAVGVDREAGLFEFPSLRKLR